MTPYDPLLPHVYDNKERASIWYQREGDTITISIRGMTNHEMRDVLVGLWARLDEDDRVDFARALNHYLLPESVLPLVAREIRDAGPLPRA